jgi:hypothetical protein
VLRVGLALARPNARGESEPLAEDMLGLTMSPRTTSSARPLRLMAAAAAAALMVVAQVAATGGTGPLLDMTTRELLALAQDTAQLTDEALDELMDAENPREALLDALLQAEAAEATTKPESLHAQSVKTLDDADGSGATTKYWLRCSHADNFTGCLADRSVLGDSDMVSQEVASVLKTRDVLARLHRHEFFLMPWPRTAEWEHHQYQTMLREPATRGGEARRSYSERWYGSSLSGNNPLRIDEIRAIIAEGGTGAGPNPDTPQAISVLRGERTLHENQRPGTTPIPSVPWKEAKKIWRLRLARELLMAGQSEEAVQIFESLCAGSRKSTRLFANKCMDRRATSMADQMLRDFLALAWFRLGEQENCISDHTHESCLAPIRGAGVHRQQRGALGAIEILNASLAIVPDDLSTQYLLNLAHQQLGSPDPETLGLDASLIYSEQLYDSSDAQRYGDMPRFLNVAAPLKLDTVSLAGGVVVDDLNNDGLLDVVSSGDGLHDQLRVYINSGHGAFEEYTERSDLQGESLQGVVGGINICHCDYNNDGNIDLFVIRGGTTV